MKFDLVERLCCPTCQTELTLSVSRERDGQVEAGVLTCRSGHSFPVDKFVPRFVDADRYVGSFSKQRQYVRRHFDHYRSDRSGYALFERTTGLTDRQISDGWTLEAGCGYGRFLDVVQTKGGRIVGVDLSTDSVNLAQDFVGLRPGVDVVQADLFQLPFRRGSFDRVFSIGVLHHTPDTRKAFEAIAPFVKPGGRLAVWVYHPDDKRSSNRWRVLTTRMSHRAVYALCVVNQAAFSWIRALPGGWRFNSLIEGTAPAKGRPFWMRVMSDFDDFSPTYAYVHTPEEVRGWFEKIGFRDIRVFERKTAVAGSAPE